MFDECCLLLQGRVAEIMHKAKNETLIGTFFIVIVVTSSSSAIFVSALFSPVAGKFTRVHCRFHLQNGGNKRSAFSSVADFERELQAIIAEETANRVKHEKRLPKARPVDGKA